VSTSPRPGQTWRFKPSRGYGAFTIEKVVGSYVYLRDAVTHRRKRVLIRTLRKDYEIQSVQ